MALPEASLASTRAAGHAATDAAALLDLMWLASPALPVGGFSYSEGLEAAIDAGLAGDELQMGDWLLDQLVLGLGRGELPVVVQALAAWRANDAARVQALHAWVITTRESAELRQQTEQMGRSMLAWLRNRPLVPGDEVRLDQLALLAPAPSWPIAYALAAARTSADARSVALSFGFGWCENMVQAAIKAVPLGQSAGQRILGRLAAALPDVVEHALHMTDEDRQAATPMLAILSARHETQYTRLFRS